MNEAVQRTRWRLEQSATKAHTLSAMAREGSARTILALPGPCECDNGAGKPCSGCNNAAEPSLMDRDFVADNDA